MRRCLAWLPGALLVVSCGAPTAPSAPPPPAAPPQPGFAATPTRGYILISIDALRGDHLSAFGYDRPTSPFLDELATRATLFENAFAQVPSTLPSHISMFTGLYPAEHGVFPPSAVLAPEIRTLPEQLHAAGFRTAGHVEGGYVQGGYGFQRGFAEWTDTPYSADTDVERTFGRGLDFLRGVKPEERFFLFLHSYTVHDPYTPPEEYRALFWPGPPPPGAGEPTGPHFAAINNGSQETTPEAVDYYESQYDASIRYLDDRLRAFFGELERLGLASDTTVILTSDHGEEFLEHGRLVHTQIYPECLRIPLIVVHPAQRTGTRVGALAQTVDFAPTIYDLAGVTPPPGMSGRSLRRELEAPDRALSGEAYAEVKIQNFQARSLLQARDATLWQALHAEAVGEADGFWASKSATFDAAPPGVEFRAVAFHQPREIAVEIDGRPHERWTFGTDWKSWRVELSGGKEKQRIRLSTAGCDSPLALGLGNDGRCLSFKLHGAPFERRELYDLTADPAAGRDLSVERDELLREMLRRLRQGYTHSPRHVPADTALSDEQIRNLKALGYLQ
jgi:hypothetical protein